ncbi:hypothetical protein FPRO04_04496 [Fusarium proliferatum]|nr:hypothetical protein FPRO03_02695 [Fusarium proliferatum]KAG4268080.1 hypothetical protein FPRO04_04496 [Fusarium proliferatum]
MPSFRPDWGHKHWKRVKSNVIGRSTDIWKASGKYQYDVLVDQFMKTAGLLEGNEQASFYDRKCKVLVCAHSKANNTPVNTGSYTTGTSVNSLTLSQCNIWEAARATSAAFGFFDPIKISWQDYVDGATGRNNPVDEVFSEAKSIWPDAPFNTVFSEIKKAIIAITTETEDTECRFCENHESFGLGGRYFRFSVDKGLRDVSLDEFDKVRKIMIATESCLNEPRVQDIIQKFSQILPISSAYEKNDYLNWLPYLDSRSTHNEARRYRKDKTTGTWFQRVENKAEFFHVATCESGDQLEVIETLGTIPLMAKTECHVMMTSRKEQAIEEAVRGLPLEKTIIPFDIGEVTADISHHLSNVVKSKQYSKWSTDLWLAFSTTKLDLAAMSELAAFETGDPECLPGFDESPILFSTRNRFDDPMDMQNLLSGLYGTGVPDEPKGFTRKFSP